MQEPFALQLYREFLRGKSISQLSGEFGITAERIEIRLRAAAAHLENGGPQVQRDRRTVKIRIVRRY
jgi:hypothetical protein